MGFLFRKSKRLDPLRIAISKSGLGASVDGRRAPIGGVDRRAAERVPQPGGGRWVKSFKRAR